MSNGLNVATQAGEGSANILNWDHFDATMQRIYQRDLYNQKAAQTEFQKMTMKLGDAASQLRPADMPKFQENYNKYKEAQLMLESGKIRNNPKLRAQWTAQAEQAYYDNMSLAQQSEDATKTKTDVWGAYMSHPENFRDPTEMQNLSSLYDQSPVATINQLGLNTASRWMHNPDTIPKDEVQKTLFGDIKTSTRYEGVNQDTKTGIYKSQAAIQTQYAQKSPTEIAMNTLGIMDRVYAYGNQWKKTFADDTKNQPEVVQSTIERAQQILDADAQKQGKQPRKLGLGYADYAAASNVLEGQTRDVGEKTITESQDWKDYQEQQKEKAITNRAYGVAAMQHKYREQEASFRDFLKSHKLSGINADEMYHAAQNPSSTYKVKTAKGEVTMNGLQLLDHRMSQIMATVPKNYDYVILNRNTLLNKADRRRILDKLGIPLSTFGTTLNNPSNDEVLRIIVKKLSDPPLPDNAGGLGLDINMNDLSTATPVIINRDKTPLQITPINLSTHNQDQFESKLGQLLQQEKPVGTIDDGAEGDASQDIIANLNRYLNQ